ncbi:MAG: choice-of-anchor D domain-containing protein [Acidobacteria bacterium]|nr:choice-of-anchor D domain-containing protein [Acidobacteriota bacterium]
MRLNRRVRSGVALVLAALGAVILATEQTNSQVGQLVISPSTIRFGSDSADAVTLGASATQTVTLRNTGTLYTLNGYCSGPSGDSLPIVGGTCRSDANLGGVTQLGPGESCTYEFRFTPTVKKIHSGSWQFGMSSPLAIGTCDVFASVGWSAQARGTTALSLTPSSFNFGSVPVGSSGPAQTFTLTNQSPSTLYGWSGGTKGPTDVKKVGGTCKYGSDDSVGTVTSLAPGESCTFVFRYSPEALRPGPQSGSVFMAMLSPGFTYSDEQANLAWTGTVTASHALSSTQYEMPASGGSRTVTMTAVAAGLPWTASVINPGNNAWLTVTTSPASGTGNGTVAFAVAPTTRTSERIAGAYVAGISVSFIQAGAAVSFTPEYPGIGPTGGTKQITVTSTSSALPWTATSSAAWLTFDGATSGTGSGSVTVKAGPLPTSTARTARVTVAGKTVTVTQFATEYSFAPNAVTIPGEGGTQTVTFTSALGSAWTATSTAPWLTVTPTSGAAGTVNTTMTLTAARTTSDAARTATVTVGGQALTVTQPGLSAAGLPSAPTGLTATVAGSTVTFDWVAPLTGEPLSRYVLEAGLAPGRSDIASLHVTDGTRFVVGGVPNGRFFVRVRSANSFGASGPSNEVEVLVGSTGTAPRPPTGLTVTVTGASLQLTWIAASTGDAPTGYTLEAGSAPSQSNIATVNLGPFTSFSVGGVPNGLYYVRVRASNSFGVSGPSNEASFSVGGVAAAPGAPSGLTATVTGGTVALAWTAPATGGPPTEYVLEAGTGPGRSDIVPGIATGSTLTAFSAAGVPPGTYYVRVKAMNILGLSAASNEVRLTVTSADVPAPTLVTGTAVPLAETDALGAPTSLAGVVEADTVALQWGAPVSGTAFTQYVLEVRAAQAADDAAWTVAATSATPTLRLADVPAGAYYVRVRTTDGTQVSPTSNALLVLVP